MINLANSTMLSVSTGSTLLPETGTDNSSFWSNYTSSNTANASNVITPSGLITDEYGSIICEQPSEEEYNFYVILAWWLEGFGQILVGSLGFIANAVAIPILLSKEMSNVFNRLLSALSVVDNVFIVCSILEAIRKHIGSTKAHQYLFGHFLYQFHNMVLCASTYITVVLALERYKAVWRPVEYRNSMLSGNPWRRVFIYVAPVVVMSVLFNVPKFFETEFATITLHNVTQWDETLNQTVYVNKTLKVLRASKLKLNSTYALLYSNVARLAVTGFIPLFLLAYFNYRIFTVLKRRRRMQNRPTANTSQAAQQKQEETRQSIMLFAIVIIFVLCHALRIILNVNTLFSLETIRASINNGCLGEPFWVLLATSFSQVLITTNASINFVIYYFMCKPFRAGLKTQTIKLVKMCLPKKVVRSLDAEPSVQNNENSRANNHTEVTKFGDTDLEVSDVPAISKKQQDISTNTNAVRSKVEEIVLPSTNSFKKPGKIEEEEETLLSSSNVAIQTPPIQSISSEMCKSGVEEIKIKDSNGKTNAKSQTPNVSFVEDKKIEEKNSSICVQNKDSANVVHDQNDLNNESRKSAVQTTDSLLNNKYSPETKHLPKSHTNKEEERTERNNESPLTTDSTLFVVNSNGRNPVTIFQADYPYFETTL